MNNVQPNDKSEIQDQKISSNEMAKQRPPWQSIIALLVLVYINLLNYMDRFTIASIIGDIQNWFSIQKKTAGLLQTVFVCSYMIFAPVFGYFGDRFSRKYVMAVGIAIWSATTLAGSFMGKDQILGFFVLRGLVGIGEASYSTVAPTIIADLFIGNQRTIALSLFFFAIPCGSGLGYIVGSRVAKALGAWYWALRVTPGLGIIAVLLVLLVLHEPKRGAKEVAANGVDSDDLSETIHVHSHSSFIHDLQEILIIPSFNLSTAGFTCISFVVGALAWWAPDFAYYGQQSLSYDASRTLESVSYIFGIVTFVGGVIGVWVGAEFSRRWRQKNEQADALVCAIGIIASVPFLFFALYLSDKLIIVMWILILLGEIMMCMNWAPNGDLLLYVIPPSCRSTAEAIQIVLIHILGDAFSPFVVGAISDAYTGNADENDYSKKHLGLLYGLYITPFVCCIGALCYFICAKYIAHDKEKALAKALEQVGVPREALDNLPNSSTSTPDRLEYVPVPDQYGYTGSDAENDQQVDFSDTENIISRTNHKTQVVI